jgi:hypothetical protein
MSSGSILTSHRHFPNIIYKMKKVAVIVVVCHHHQQHEGDPDARTKRSKKQRAAS